MTPHDKEDAMGSRCPWMVTFDTLSTRCAKPADHLERGDRQHEGAGLPQFEYQRIAWFAGDRRERITDRTDARAWDEATA